MDRTIRTPLLIALALCLPTGRLAAQGWLPAAAEAARVELAADWGYQGTVLLAGAAQEPIAAVPGSSLYTAAVSGTAWVAWGVLDATEAPVVSAVARAIDPVEALRVFARDLARFRAGDRAFPEPFWDSTTTLYSHPLSNELRVTLVRALLDVRAADPDLWPGSFCSMSMPVQQLAYTTAVPIARVAALLGRAVREWDLDAGPYRREVAACPFALHQAMYNRLREGSGGDAFATRPEEDEALLPLMRELVDRVTAEDRSLHPGWESLAQVVATHHLDVVVFFGAPALEGRDPRVLHQFLAEWWRARADGLETIPPGFVDAAQALTAALPRSSLESAETRAWVADAMTREVELAARRATLGSILHFLQRITGVFRHGDLRWYTSLAPATRAILLEMVHTTFDDGLPSQQVEALRFLAWLELERALTPDQSLRARTLAERELPVLVARRLADPLPPQGPESYPSSDFLAETVAIAELAKAMGLSAFGDPLVAASNPRFAGDAGFAAESEAEYAARLEALLGLWRRYGVVVIDAGHRSVRNLELLRDIDRFLAVVPRDVRFPFSLFVYGYYALSGAGNGSVFLGYDSARDPIALNAERQRLPRWLQHEVGHLVQERAPLELERAWQRTYERSVADLDHPNNYDPDEYHCRERAYAATEGNEDFAEHFVSFFRDNQGFLIRAAIVSANTGNTVLIEKYAGIADLLGRGLLGGNGWFPLTEGVETYREWEDGGIVLHFRTLGSARVAARDADGRVLALESPDAGFRYTLSWSDGRVAGVELGTPAAESFFQDGFESGSTSAWAGSSPPR